MRLWSKCCFVVWLLCAPEIVQAQSNSILWGPHVSYTFGTPLDINRPAINTLGSNGLGTSYAQTFGGGIEIAFPKVILSQVGCSLIGNYSWSTGEFTSNSYSSSDNATSATSTQEFHLSSRYQTASLTGLVAFHLSDSWDVGLGGTFGYRTQDALTDWREILSPAGVTFSNGSTRDTIATGNSLTASPWNTSILIFAGHSFAIGSGISLAGRIFGSLDLQNLSAGYGSQSIGGGISLSVLFGNREPKLSVAETIEKIPAPARFSKPVEQLPKPVERPPSNIHAAIHLQINGIQARTASVREVDTLVETYTVTPGNTRIPKAASQLIRSYIVPDLSVSRFVESEAPIEGWNIRILQGERTLSEYSNLDSSQSGSLNASIDLGRGTKPAPIIAELRVTDVVGTIRSANDTLELSADTSSLADRIHVQKYLFLPQTSANLRHQDSLLLRNLLASLDSSGVLTIAPTAAMPSKELCPMRDLLSNWVITELQSKSIRPRIIEILDKPISNSMAEDDPETECGILVHYIRE